MPGSRIPIVHPDRLAEDKPDKVWILPSNWAKEIYPKVVAVCPDAEIAYQRGTMMASVL